jgi:hypothetical protein
MRVTELFCLHGSSRNTVRRPRQPVRLRRMFLERYVNQRRQIQRAIIEDSIALGELKPTTDPELLTDMLSGPLFFRWLQGHAPLDKAFAKSIFDKVISAFQAK